MKHEKIDLAAASNRENQTREEVTLLCEIRQGTRPWKAVRLDDISQTGFRIAWLPDGSVDSALRIRVPGLQPLSATIRWREGKAVGCAFETPLHIAVFEHIVARTRVQF